MISEQEAISIVKNYLEKKEIVYLSIHDRVQRIESEEIRIGEYKGQKRERLVVCYSTEGHQYDNWVFVNVDAENGDVLFITTKHGSQVS